MAMAHKSDQMGMHTEQLAGRSQQRFFRPEEEERFTSPQAFEVDFKKRTQFDAAPMSSSEVNLKLRELMSQGYGSVVMKNPGAKHSLAVGILNRLNLTIEGSLGYFGCGLIDGPNIHIKGRVGWSSTRTRDQLSAPRCAAATSSAGAMWVPAWAST